MFETTHGTPRFLRMLNPNGKCISQDLSAACIILYIPWDEIKICNTSNMMYAKKIIIKHTV